MNKIYYLLLVAVPSLLSSCMLHDEYQDNQEDDTSPASVQQETVKKAHQEVSSTKNHTSHVYVGRSGKPGRNGLLFGEPGEDGGAGGPGKPAQVEEQ